MKTHYLPFNNISDLLKKVKLIKKAHVNQYKNMKAELERRNIPYETVMEYGISISIDGLSDEQIEFVTNSKNDGIKRVYEFLNIETREFN